MPDVYTTTGSVDYDTAAYQLALRYALRPELYFDPWAEVKSDNVTHNGSSVRFFIQNDLAVATTPLVEDVDVSAVPMSDSFVDVTMLEYGNATVTTARLEATSMFAIDAAAANVIGFNAGISIDTIARNAFQVGTQVVYATGTGSAPANRAAIVPANILRATDIRRAYAKLSGQNVAKKDGAYLCFIHPDVMFDLKQETGDLGWRAPHVYGGDAEVIYTGDAGMFEGFRFIVSPRAPLFVDGGTTNTDVYRTIFMGAEGFAKAYSNAGGYGAQPVIVEGPITDKLRRFRPIGWKHFVGYSIFRQTAVYNVESASSIGNNGVG